MVVPRLLTRAVCATAIVALSVVATSGHGDPPATGNLLGTGEFGAIELAGQIALGTVGDVAVSTGKEHAYVTTAATGECTDAGIWILDISNAETPANVGFIALPKDTEPIGVQAVSISTRVFDGEILVVSSEQCGKGRRGAVMLWDVTDPLKPRKLSEHFGVAPMGDASRSNAAFAWDAGESAYAAVAGRLAPANLEILDISNPWNPRSLVEIDLESVSPPLVQPALGLTELVLQNIVVKRVAGCHVALLSLTDGGFVQLDVEDPLHPVLIGNTDYAQVDPELLESLGVVLSPAGGGHSAAYTADSTYFVATDQDFRPYRESTLFDGWGYVHLYRNVSIGGKFQEFDTYAIPEAHDSQYAIGFGPLTAHEVVTHPVDSQRAYVAYQAGGLRMLELQCFASSCELVEVGGYLGSSGNNIVGVDVFERGGQTIVVVTDKNRGVILLRDLTS